jgi:hypothetical protein
VPLPQPCPRPFPAWSGLGRILERESAPVFGCCAKGLSGYFRPAPSSAADGGTPRQARVRVRAAQASAWRRAAQSTVAYSRPALFTRRRRNASARARSNTRCASFRLAAGRPANCCLFPGLPCLSAEGGTPLQATFEDALRKRRLAAGRPGNGCLFPTCILSTRRIRNAPAGHVRVCAAQTPPGGRPPRAEGNRYEVFRRGTA